MALYKRGYRPHEGAFTPGKRRFLVIPKFALAGIFESRPLLAFFMACFVPMLVSLAIVYVGNSKAAQSMLELRNGDIVSITGFFFARIMIIQSTLAFLLAAWIGPGLVSVDLSHDALPLYLSRPFSRSEYVLGKFSVVALLLSAITWVPGLILFGVQADLAGWDWFTKNLWMAGSILLGSWLWIALVGLLTLALSAWVKWRIVATAVTLGVFFVLAGFGHAVNEVLRTNLGYLLNIGYLMGRMWFGLFGVSFEGRLRSGGDLPSWMAWMVFGLISVFCLFVLNRRLRAREVVR